MPALALARKAAERTDHLICTAPKRRLTASALPMPLADAPITRCVHGDWRWVSEAAGSAFAQGYEGGHTPEHPSRGGGGLPANGSAEPPERKAQWSDPLASCDVIPVMVQPRSTVNSPRRMSKSQSRYSPSGKSASDVNGPSIDPTATHDPSEIRRWMMIGRGAVWV